MSRICATSCGCAQSTANETGEAVGALTERLSAIGETLDGEGGYTVYGRLMPAADSIVQGALPLGLAHGVTLKNAIA